MNRILPSRPKLMGLLTRAMPIVGLILATAGVAHASAAACPATATNPLAAASHHASAASLSAAFQETEIAWPETRAGVWLQKWTAAFNQATEAGFRSFYEEVYSDEAREKTPIEEQLPEVMKFVQQVGQLQVHSVEADGEYIASAIAKADKLKMWVKLTVELNSEPPYDEKSVLLVPTQPPNANKVEVDYGGWQSLTELAELARTDAGAPAVAVAVIQDGALLEAAVVGTRKAGSDQPVAPQDRFHLGSVSKSMTSTMIGKLVEQGVLRWELTLREALPEWEIREEYRAVTLEQLIQHRAGLQRDPDMDQMSEEASSHYEGRIEVCRWVLQQEPVNEPGSGSEYSNAGYVLAAHIAELHTGHTWEELMRGMVFEPLELGTAGIGWPATLAFPDQPHGHHGSGEDIEAQAPGAGIPGFDLGKYLGPAGDVKCSIRDLARYANAHLQGLRGQDGLLSAATIQRLHTPLAEEAGAGYAGGWVIEKQADGGPKHWHNGSAGTFFTLVTLYPESNLAVVCSTNVGFSGSEALTRVTEEARRRFQAEKP